MAQRHLPALLIIMDGCGLAPADGENAVAAAKTPFLDSLYEKYPHTTLGASGEDVGLPDGQMGNSEVGHLNIGAGRIVFQELSRIKTPSRTAPSPRTRFLSRLWTTSRPRARPSTSWAL